MSFVCEKRESETIKTLHGAVPKTKVNKYSCKITDIISDIYNDSKLWVFQLLEHLYLHCLVIF